MSSPPVTVAEGLTLGRFIDEVASRRRHTTYSVLSRDGTVLGLLAFRCLTSVPRAEWNSRTVKRCMIPADRVARFQPSTPALEAFNELTAADANGGVVLADGHLVGIISAADFSRVRPARRSVAAPSTYPVSARLITRG